jgi:hypothetical protein
MAHHLVLEAFVGPRPDGMQCCHGDGNRQNNSPGNLRWDTPLANSRDKQKHGTQCHGSGHGGAKLSDSDVVKIKAMVNAGVKRAYVGRLFGVSAFAVYAIVSGKKWKHIPMPTEVSPELEAEILAAIDGVRREKEVFKKARGSRTRDTTSMRAGDPCPQCGRRMLCTHKFKAIEGMRFAIGCPRHWKGCGYKAGRFTERTR